MAIQTQRLTGNLFNFIAVPLSAIGWLIYLIGLAVLDGTDNVGNLGIYWFYFVWFMFVILLVLGTSLAGSTYNYRLPIIALLAITFTFLVEVLRFSKNVFDVSSGRISSSSGAVFAGAFLLLLAIFIWIFTIGAEPGTLASGPENTGITSHFTRNRNRNSAGHVAAGGPGAVEAHGAPVVNANGAPHMTSMAPADAVGADHTAVPVGAAAGLPVTSPMSANGSTASQIPTVPSTMMDQPDAPASYPHRAKALYPYTASPEDPNELSFTKGEILNISSTQGKWWQARKADGTVGICPSNYVQLC